MMTAVPIGAADLVFESADTRLELESAQSEAVFMHGEPSLSFRLTGEGSTAFAELTGGMIGDELSVSLCGIELMRPVVRERLEGRGIVSMPNIEIAIVVAEVIRGEAECAALDSHYDK